MTTVAKTKFVKAESVKNFLLKKNIYNTKYLIKKDENFVYFPIKKKMRIIDAEVIQKKLLSKPVKKGLKESLKYKLTKKELSKLVKSYDLVGSVAIIEIPTYLKKKESVIAKTVLKLNKNIKTVLKKSDVHRGEFRTQKLKWLVGKKTKETLYKENNVLIKFDVEKLYFSIRLSTERKRICKQIKKQERVLVMFSGCAPYVLTIAKNSKAKDVFGIEKNKLAHNYGIENLKLNKISNANLFCGDVRKILPTLNKKFDRILMPLPKSAEEFLELIPPISNKGTVIHFYTFGTAEDIKTIKCLIKKKLPNTRLLKTIRCGSYSPNVFRYCIDFKITTLK